MGQLKNLILILGSASLLACSMKAAEPSGIRSIQSSPKDRYFGYVGIDCGTNYVNEVAAYTNLNHLCVHDTSDIRARLEAFKAKNVKAFVDLHHLFYQEGGSLWF